MSKMVSKDTIPLEADALTFLPEEDRAKVRTRIERWNKSLSEGVIADLHISEWSALVTLSDEDWQSLGVPMEDDDTRSAFNRVMRGGRFELVPHEAISTIRAASSRARNALTEYCVWTWMGGLILGKTYPRWKEATAAAEADFWAGVEYLCANLRDGENLVGKAAEDFTKVFGAAWDQMNRLRDGRDVPPKAEFVEGAVKKLTDAVPSAEFVRSRYLWEIDLSYAPTMNELLAESQRAGEARSGLDTVTEQIRADVEARESERMLRIVESLEIVERDYYSHLSETLEQAKAALDGRDSVPPQTSRSLRNLLDYASRINVLGDDKVESMIANCVALLDNAKAKGSDNKKVKARLAETLLEANEAVAGVLRDIPRYSGRRIDGYTDEESEKGAVREVPVKERPKGAPVKRAADVSDAEAAVDSAAPTRKITRRKAADE